MRYMRVARKETDGEKWGRERFSSKEEKKRENVEVEIMNNVGKARERGFKL